MLPGLHSVVTDNDPDSVPALLGELPARTLLFNVLLPLVVLLAREEKNRKLEANAWAVIEAFPALPKNSVTQACGQCAFLNPPFRSG